MHRSPAPPPGRPLSAGSTCPSTITYTSARAGRTRTSRSWSGCWPDPTLELARELGVSHRILEFAGVSEPDLATLYRSARALLYPSLVEGYGLPLLEAMAAGVPVIASDVPVFREVAGDAAMLVPPFDTSAWVSAIIDLDDPGRRDALIAAGRRRAAAATWDRAADRLTSILIGG
jgi:glycosyltransferase involved in cell wall biosynthesis